MLTVWLQNLIHLYGPILSDGDQDRAISWVRSAKQLFCCWCLLTLYVIFDGTVTLVQCCNLKMQRLYLVYLTTANIAEIRLSAEPKYAKLAKVDIDYFPKIKNKNRKSSLTDHTDTKWCIYSIESSSQFSSPVFNHRLCQARPVNCQPNNGRKENKRR